MIILFVLDKFMSSKRPQLSKIRKKQNSLKLSHKWMTGQGDKGTDVDI